jgi:hypothetical protein
MPASSLPPCFTVAPVARVDRWRYNVDRVDDDADDDIEHDAADVLHPLDHVDDVPLAEASGKTDSSRGW